MIDPRYAIMGKRLNDLEKLKEEHAKLERLILTNHEENLIVARQNNVDIQGLLANRPVLSGFIRELQRRNFEQARRMKVIE